MAVLEIPSRLSESKIEQLLLKLHSEDTDIDILLPLAIDYRGFGIFPHFFLLFFTWMRKNTGKVLLPVDINDEQSIISFIYNYYGYAIVSTVWKKNDIETLNQVSLKGYLRNYTSKMYNNIDFLDNLPKEAVMIPNFDHYSKLRGLSHWFYDANFQFFDTPSALENTLFRILEQLSVNFRQKIKAGANLVFEDLREILWELMKNTNEHAVTDYANQVILDPNCRCAFFRIHQSSKANFLKASKDHRGLSRYYEAALTAKVNFLLEISVFDSGPGIVKRFVGKDWNDTINVNEDVKVIKKCLIKGQTSVQTSQSQNKGFGLDRVLKLLDRQQGFLKIRTGRVSVYRDLISDPYIHTTDPDNISLLDWQTNASDVFTEMGSIEGTMISLVYPISLNDPA